MGELRELSNLWEEVEQKRKFIIGRIDKLAKKFPQSAYDPEPDQPVPLTENEVAFETRQNALDEVKHNDKIINQRLSRLNHIINKDKKNKSDWVSIKRAI